MGVWGEKGGLFLCGGEGMLWDLRVKVGASVQGAGKRAAVLGVETPWLSKKEGRLYCVWPLWPPSLSRGSVWEVGVCEGLRATVEASLVGGMGS